MLQWALAGGMSPFIRRAADAGSELPVHDAWTPGAG